MSIFKSLTLRRKRKSDVKQLLSSVPAFPGTNLHVCVEDATPNEVEECQQELSFPVHVHNVVSGAGSGGATISKTMRAGASRRAGPLMMPFVAAGSTAVQGQRSHMEDRDRWLDFDEVQRLSGSDSTPPAAFFAVYDGHAGHRAADICLERMHDRLAASGAFHQEAGRRTKDETVLQRIQAAITQLDEEIVKEGLEEGWGDGSCVSIVILLGSVLYTANLGDSHIALGSTLSGGGTKGRQLTVPHKASEASEKQRITSVGGMVMRGRVFGDLAISRAVGDLNFKVPKQEANFVSNEAYCTATVLSPTNGLFVVASDGLWDKMTPDEAIEYATAARKEGKTAEEASKVLLDVVVERQSLDNITAMVVYLEWVAEAEYDERFVKASEGEGSASQEEIECSEESSGAETTDGSERSGSNTAESRECESEEQ